MVFWNHGTLIVSVVSLQKLLYKFRDWITFMRCLKFFFLLLFFLCPLRINLLVTLHHKRSSIKRKALCVCSSQPGRGAERQHGCSADRRPLQCSSIPGQEGAVFPWAQLSSAPGDAPEVTREAAESFSGVLRATFSSITTEENWDFQRKNNNPWIVLRQKSRKDRKTRS